MSKRFIETERDKAMLVRFIESQALPFAASITRGGKRSLEQNRLQRLWLSEISEQMGDRSSEDVRGYCKLHFGVPILREQDPGFREKYDKAVKPLSYEQKIAIMMEPLDLPVTRLMTTKQHTEYLDAIYQNFAKEGFILTEPSALARNYNPQSSDAPSPSDDGSDGEAASPGQTVAATLSDPAAADQEEDASEPAGGQHAASSSDLSPEDRDWLKLAARMLWAATGINEQETLANQFKAVRDYHTPETVSRAARDRGNAIYQRLKLICAGSKGPAETLQEIAMCACCDTKEIVS